MSGPDSGPATCKIFPSEEQGVATANGQEALSDGREPKADKRYRILGVLGEGANGQVYLAVRERAHLSRYVAFKVLRDENPSSVLGLRREAAMMASLHHPLFPRLIEFTSLSHQYALVMEWLPGLSLYRAVNETGRLPASVTFEIIAHLANGLRALHYRADALGGSAAHCDIKPGNIQIGPFGSVRLMDLGSARVRGAQWTASTHPYSAPELHKGTASPAVDVFSLGVVLLAMLTRLPDPTIASPKAAAHYRETHLKRFPRRLARKATGLLRRMLDPHPEKRPSVESVEVACRGIRRSLDGPCIAEWASSEAIAHAPIVAKRGELTGLYFIFLPGTRAMTKAVVEDLQLPLINQPFSAFTRTQE